jgi:membrane protease YdiL (CAAX protease family)
MGRGNPRQRGAAVKEFFLTLVVLHLGYSIVSNRGAGDVAHRPPTRMGAITQVPMFLMAMYFAIDQNALSRDLVSPLNIALGLLIGHVIFTISLLITHQSLSDGVTQFLDLRGLWKFCVEAPYVVTRFASVAIAEEIIWRVALQPVLTELMHSVWLAIVVTAIGFAVVHHHFFRNSLIVSIEFTLFALVLGWLYYWTGSLILVIVIHAVRDIEIAYLEYLVKVEEYGDAEKAEKEMETMYQPSRRLKNL